LRAQVGEKAPEIDWPLMATTAAVSFAAAFGVSGGTNLVMIATKNDLIKKYKPTLEFWSAWIGDGVIVPLVNCLMIRSLVLWKPRLKADTALVPVLGGPAISLLFHIQQGRGGMVNWTMTRPWRWNWLGYYHFVYMSTQFSYMLLYLTQLAKNWTKGRVAGWQKRDLAIIAANMALFALLLGLDYQE
jgi:hypothetical protein